MHDLHYHLFHILPHRMQVLKYFEALLSFPSVWQVFLSVLVGVYYFCCGHASIFSIFE